MVPAERMAAGREILALRYEVGDQLALQAGKLLPRGAPRPAAAHAARFVGYVIVVDEFHRISRQAEQALVGLVRLAGHARPQLLEDLRGTLLETESRMR